MNKIGSGIIRRQKDEQKAELNKGVKSVLWNLLKYKDRGIYGHLRRVREYTEILTRKMVVLQAADLDERKIRMIAEGSIYHDIGKLTVPDKILNKNSQLGTEEFERIKTHTVNGEKIVNNLKGIWKPEMHKIMCNICRSHHERYDGSGYPDGLKGESIPLEAQIVSVADVFDALVSKRIYKEAYVCEVAFKMIENGECGSFSDRILHTLSFVKNEFVQVSQRKSS